MFPERWTTPQGSQGQPEAMLGSIITRRRRTYKIKGQDPLQRTGALEFPPCRKKKESLPLEGSCEKIVRASTVIEADSGRVKRSRRGHTLFRSAVEVVR